MAKQRLSHLQRRILAWIEAEYVRTKGSITPDNMALVAAFSDKHHHTPTHAIIHTAEAADTQFHQQNLELS